MTEKKRRVCKDCKHFKGGKYGARGGTIGRCELRDVIGTHRIGSVTACILFEEEEKRKTKEGAEE